MSQYYPSSYESSVMTPATGLERLAAAVCHAALLFGIPFLVPLAVFLLNPVVLRGSPYVRQQALQSMLFHAVVLLISAVSGAIAWAFVFHGLFFIINLLSWPIAAAFGLVSIGVLVWGVVIELIAMVRALQGQPYRLPIVGRW